METLAIPSTATNDLLVRLEECLGMLDELGRTVLGARLSYVVETVRAELAEPSGQVACLSPM